MNIQEARIAKATAQRTVQEMWYVGRMDEILAALLSATRDCRDDMHEPDEQGVSAVVRGKSFDNAGTDNEMHLVLTRQVGEAKQTISFNLCDLIALARKADTTRKTLICSTCGKRTDILFRIKTEDIHDPNQVCPDCWEGFGDSDNRPKIIWIIQGKYAV